MGSVVGIVAAFALIRLLSFLLYGVQAIGLQALAGAVLASAWGPERQAC